MFAVVGSIPVAQGVDIASCHNCNSVIQPKCADPFSGSFASICIGTCVKWEYIDESGNEIGRS